MNEIRLVVTNSLTGDRTEVLAGLPVVAGRRPMNGINLEGPLFPRVLFEISYDPARAQLLCSVVGGRGVIIEGRNIRNAKLVLPEAFRIVAEHYQIERLMSDSTRPPNS